MAQISEGGKDINPMVQFLNVQHLSRNQNDLYVEVSLLSQVPEARSSPKKSIDPVHLYSLYSYLQNVNTVLLDSPEALCLHSAGSYTDCTNELDL